MLFSNRDYFTATEPIDEKLLSRAKDFITDDEEIIYTCDSTDIVTFFTNKKAIFVSDIVSQYFEVELLPYKSISRCTVIGSYTVPYGKLDICVSDEIILAFLLDSYNEARALCQKILQGI